MKKIKVISEVYIFCSRNMPSDQLAFETEQALNSMGTLEIGGMEALFMAPTKAAVRFHFKNEQPEIIIGEDPKND
jgi:hypothetical protein